ncbi:Peptidase family m20 m25 m40 protein [Teratosphaeria destructans]|uniref:Peptidase family m20 m25 m40 protein n=1 Tax=Teratosphaeria destructans TaxID=418781 RepID=A0A9W7T0T9_9PEZI|nr:Peptidase family m20 m25 m40 protein [Teratosphaeria destructans]
MSLFNLFSKPKIEKAHGYAEQGLDLPLDENFNARSEHLTVPVPPHSDVLANDGRPSSAMSSQKPSKTRPNKPDDKPRPWTPPPLFQAYPQASKHGVMEVSTVAETLAAKAKGRKAAGLRTLDHEHLSRDAVAYSNHLESKSATRAPVKDSARPTSSPTEVTKKILVLVTSGYLLQYAHTGPSDRLPERILQLSKDSAAFACDLISGKHYVLQISHAVNSEGMSISNTSNIFSRLSIRSAVSKKMSATLLLVTKDAREMNTWMVAIREEIEILGGRKSRPDTTVDAMLAGTADGFSELKKRPSLSHRYNVARATGATIPSRQDIESMPAPPSSKQEDPSFDKSETNTIDDIEQEMEQLVDDRPASAPQKQQRDSDARSVRSSIALSADSCQLCSPQSSRISYSTFATTAATSRTSSPSESQMADSEKWSSDSSRDSDQSRSFHVSRSSLNVGDGKRRSVMPSGTKKQQPLRVLDKDACTRPRSQNNGRHAPKLSATLLTPPRKLAVAASEPDLRAVLENRTRYDSRLEDVVERPQSIVAELPSLADYNANTPNKRLSWKHAAKAQTKAYRLVARPPVSNSAATSAPATATVHGSQRPQQHFSIPLKIKPTTPADRPSCQSEAKAEHIDADADTECRVLNTSPEAHKPNRERTSSGRLSLFPSQVHPVIAPDGPLPALPLPKRSSPERTPHQPQANARTLKRPASLQVLSDPAPFLHGVQGCRTPGTSQVSHARPTPIRSLKSSRSSHAISTATPSLAVLRSQPSPTDPFMQFSARPLPMLPAPVQEDETGDHPMPLLPHRSASPRPVRPRSRQANGRLRTKASLPELDFGMPLAGLGPPAPPPSAPLPRPPTAERSVSPAATRATTGEAHGLAITIPT